MVVVGRSLWLSLPSVKLSMSVRGNQRLNLQDEYDCLFIQRQSQSGGMGSFGLSRFYENLEKAERTQKPFHAHDMRRGACGCDPIRVGHTVAAIFLVFTSAHHK